MKPNIFKNQAEASKMLIKNRCILCLIHTPLILRGKKTKTKKTNKQKKVVRGSWSKPQLFQISNLQLSMSLKLFFCG